MLHTLRLLFLFLALSLSATNAQSETYRLVTAPFQPFTDPHDPRGGLLVSIAEAALDARGHKLEVTYRPWARALTEAAAGRYDGLLSAFYNEERAQSFYYSAPLNSTEMVFVTLRDRVPFSSYVNFDQLMPYRIATGRKWVYSPAFEQNKKLQKSVVSDEPAGIRMLFSKRVDLFAVSLDQFRFHMGKMAEFDIGQTQVLKPAISINDQHIAASRHRKESVIFLNEFNTGLAAIKASGRYDQIKNSFLLF